MNTRYPDIRRAEASPGTPLKRDPPERALTATKIHIKASMSKHRAGVQHKENAR